MRRRISNGYSASLYRKKFFLAYYLYINSLSNKLVSMNVLHSSLQDFLLELLQKYKFFLNQIKNPLLIAKISRYGQTSLEASNRLRLLYINKTSIKRKLIQRSRQKLFTINKLKKLKVKKYFFLSFTNLSSTKNLIIKYKNLLFLTKKRIDLFKLKGVRSNYLSNLY